jgi:hypothetical protein
MCSKESTRGLICTFFQVNPKAKGSSHSKPHLLNILSKMFFLMCPRLNRRSVSPSDLGWPQGNERVPEPQGKVPMSCSNRFCLTPRYHRAYRNDSGPCSRPETNIGKFFEQTAASVLERIRAPPLPSIRNQVKAKHTQNYHRNSNTWRHGKQFDECTRVRQ